MLKSFWSIRLWTDFDENLYNANFMNTQFLHKCHFYVMEKFCEYIYFKSFWPNYNLDLRSYGQLLSLFTTCLDKYQVLKLDILKRECQIIIRIFLLSCAAIIKLLKIVIGIGYHIINVWKLNPKGKEVIMWQSWSNIDLYN